MVIGSGATAVTLVPAMAPDAAHVTMLQRSPTYILSLAAARPDRRTPEAWLPDRLAHRLVRLEEHRRGLGLLPDLAGQARDSSGG